jgi:hypothetical protein
MHKSMLHLDVYTDEGRIIIDQPDPLGNVTTPIHLMPEQVDTLIAWLKDAKDALASESSGGRALSE